VASCGESDYPESLGGSNVDVQRRHINLSSASGRPSNGVKVFLQRPASRAALHTATRVTFSVLGPRWVSERAVFIYYSADSSDLDG